MTLNHLQGKEAMNCKFQKSLEGQNKTGEPAAKCEQRWAPRATRAHKEAETGHGHRQGGHKEGCAVRTFPYLNGRKSGYSSTV